MKKQTTDIKISDIQVSDRFRKDHGDLKELAQSIAELGLLQPIGVTPDNRLVFGERRLKAVQDILGWETIPVLVIDIDSMLHGQYAENEHRKDFTISERVAIVNALRSYSHGGDRKSDQVRNGDNDSLTLAEAREKVGFGKDSFYRAEDVVERGIPELVDAMDAEKLSINAAHELAQAAPDEQQECLKKKFDEGRATARTIRKHLRFIRCRKAREEAADRTLESPKSGDEIQIHHCPFQELESLAGLEPESARLICTDIPYGDDFVEQIEELAELAERVLVPGGTFVAYLGHHRFNDKLRALDKHLNFQWLSTAVWTGARNGVPRLKLVSKSIPIVVYSKGEWEPLHMWSDTFVTEHQEKDWHPWQRPLGEVENLVRYFSRPGDLVIDPCGGGFTTAIACQRENRRFVGCDTDKAAVAKGQERLKLEQTQPVLQPMKPVSVNDITEGDCRQLIPSLPEKSINLAVTSPPYADQRKGMYPGIPEDQYADFTVEWMKQLWDKLTDDGSVMMVIRPHIKQGVISDYVLRTRLALREFGWKECEELIWHKPDGGNATGSNRRPRRSFEHILWFSKTHDPYIDTKACGEWSDRHGFVGKNRFGLGSNKPHHTGPSTELNDGISRSADVIHVPVAKVTRGIMHPAMFPIPLADHLIKTFCPEGGTVLDCFAGSGSTLIAAKQLGRQFYGFDIMPEYVEMARQRLATINEEAEVRDFAYFRQELRMLLEDCLELGGQQSKQHVLDCFKIIQCSQAVDFETTLASMPRKLRDFYKSLPLTLAA